MKKLRKLSLKARSGLIITVFSVLTITLSSAGSRNFEIARNLDVFSNLFREVVVNYVDEVNVSEVMKSGIDGMLSSLDPYTTFIPESEIEDVRFMTTGQYGGIGALVRPREGKMMIAESYEGFPAYRAGLLPGDIILEVNGQSTEGRDENEVRALLQGQPGTSLNIRVERNGEQIAKSLEREVVRVDNIPYFGMLNETTAYIKLTSFTQRAGREVKAALESLMNDNNVESVIIDLRDNGGGLLNEAVNIANLFVEKDELIVSTKGRLPDRSSTHLTLNEPVDKELPLAVLINRSSASASEIVAGAVQDLDRGIIIGNRSFGKGLVQNVVPLSYNTQLKVTVAEYFIPSGRGIQAINYAERREDGSVAEIPDSLKRPHTTRAGRTVYDGGGIEPDIYVQRPEPANVTRALARQFMIFDFATHFRKENDEIPPAEGFYITDGIYSDFLDFVAGKDFSYYTGTEELLEELQETASGEKYFSAIEQEFQSLQQRIKREKEQDFITFRDEIEQLLREEIVSRYYYRKGRVVVSLDSDPDVEKALGVLNDPGHYDGILAGVN